MTIEMQWPEASLRGTGAPGVIARHPAVLWAAHSVVDGAGCGFHS